VRRVLAALAVALSLGATAAAVAAPAPSPHAAAPDAAAPGGIEVGPPLPPVPPPPGDGEEVEAGEQRDPGFFDFPGKIRAAIDDWFRGLVKDALNPAIELLGRTLLATPQVSGQARVRQFWRTTLGIADALLVLFLIAGGVLLMTHETLQTRYAVKDVLPRIVFAAIAVNASLSISGHLIEIANALSAGFIGGGVDARQAAHRLSGFVVGAIEGGGIFLILLGLACAVFTVVLLVLYIVRAALVVLLVCAAPLMLLGHALPQTEGIAHLWWRAMAAALAVQVAQSLVLAATLRVFFTPDGRDSLGLTSSGSLIDLLVALCLLWVLVKIPFWAKELAFRGRTRSSVASTAKTYVLAKAWRAA
jgi:hypothetical protein